MIFLYIYLESSPKSFHISPQSKIYLGWKAILSQSNPWELQCMISCKKEFLSRRDNSSIIRERKYPTICIKTYARNGWRTEPVSETFLLLFSLPWKEYRTNNCIKLYPMNKHCNCIPRVYITPCILGSNQQWLPSVHCSTCRSNGSTFKSLAL